MRRLRWSGLSVSYALARAAPCHALARREHLRGLSSETEALGARCGAHGSVPLKWAPFLQPREESGRPLARGWSATGASLCPRDRRTASATIGPFSPSEALGFQSLHVIKTTSRETRRPERVCRSLGCELAPRLPLLLSRSCSGEQKALLMESFTNLARRPGLRPSPRLRRIERVCVPPSSTQRR